jgi:RHS repeat-associated protein
MTKTGVTSQDVNIELIINSQVNGDGTFVEGTGTTVNIAVIPKDVIGTHFSLPDNFVVLTPNSTVTRSLLPLTNIRIKIITGTKADMDLISWDPKLRYSSMKYSTWSPEYIYQDLGPAVESPMPYEADLVNDNTTWIRNMAVRPVFTDTSGDTSSVNFTFTAKKYMELLGKGKITVSGGTAPAQNIMLSDIMVGDNVYFECFTNTLTNYAYITIAEPVYVPGVMPNFYPGVVTPGIIDKNADTLGDLFATPYRGWAVAGIKGNPDLSTYTADNLPDGYGPFSSPATLIDESKLSVSQYEGLTYTVSDIDQVEFAAIPGDPDKPGDTTDTISNTIDSWKAINEIYSTGTEMGSSRMGAKFIKKYSIADIIGDSAGGTQNAVMAMNRVSKSIQYGGSSSVVPGAFGSVGDSWSLADYIDMNGDGYPDFVSLSGGIQYTNPDGTMGNTITSFASGQDIRRSTAISFGVGTATNASVQLPTGQGDTGVSPDESISSNTGSQTVVASNAPDVSVGISGSGSLNISGGTSSSKKELMDMNGDGLPDMVEIDGNSINVYLNTGYGFATTPTYWNCTYTANVYIGESANAGGSAGAGIDLGVDVGPVGIGVSGGVVGGVTISKALEALVDVNGDGLPDYLDVNGNVYYNTGNGFGPPVPSGLDLTHGIGSSVNAGYSYGFSVSLRILVCYIGGSYSKSNGNSMSKQYDMLADINGDGFPDKISAIGSESMNVIYSSIGRTNLLQRVTRPMGATIDLDYQRSVNTHDMPRPRWNLKSVIVKDGVTADDLTPGSEDRITTYTYSGGKYDMLEREFYGYSWVTETAQLNSTDTRITARQYFDPTLNPGNDDYYLKGLLWHEYVYLNDAYNSNVLYYEKQNTYSEQKVFNQGLDYQFFADKYSYFPELSSTTETYHEGLTNLTKTNNYGYDSCGNITSFSEKGSESGSNDLVSAAVNYVNVNAGTDFTAASILNCTPTALNLAQNITVTDNAPGAPGRNRTATYDTIGNLTHVIQHSTGSEDSDTQMVYDNYGNLTSIIMPNNESNGSAQNYTMNFVYDTTTESQAITVSDSLYKSTADYNYMFGKPISTTDINNQSMNYYYDSYGRLTGVAGPNESSGQYAALYFYNPAAAVPNATTKNRDMANQPGTIDIITITDGLGRVIQTKKDATVAQQGSGLDALTSGSSMIVSGMEYYDNGGRKIRQYYPTYEAKTADNTALNTSIAAYYTNFIYDAYDRVHDVKMPDNTHTLFAYDSDGGRFRTIMTDANLNYKDTYKDTKQLIRMVKEFDKNDAGHPLITTYGYDAMGEITQVVEDSGNTNETTTITYDMLGRRTSINNPDTGLVTTVYDPASNVIKKITPDISPSAIQYHYDLNNRLTWIQYPASVNDVHYTYGSATGDGTNSAGRVNLVQYGMGSQQRSYDGLGNVTKLIDNITRLDNGENDTFTTLYTWDNTGRMLTMTYPTNDGQTEQLTYSYDKGGLVSGVTGAITGGPTTVYASNILYDEFEKRLEIDDGNAICTRYMYNGNDRRLGELITGVTNTAGTILYNIQDLHYSYDYVGNITMVANNMTKTYDDIPESVNRWFSYDGYNRLTSTAGTLHDNDAGLDRLGYSEAMAYDRIHNIISKQQNVSYLNSYAGAPQTNAGSTYNLTYNYNYNALSPAGPHAPTSIIDSIAPSKERDYKYDANGNQTGYTIGTTTPYAYQRTMSWDEENRLRSITETASGVPSLAEHYWYNDSGERIIKRTVNDNSGTMEYVNQFTSQATSDGVTGSLITKHIYVGNDRIASKVIPVGGLPKISAQTYYYHKDHLGSSGYITNSLGIIDEHEEYTPWGESWLEQKSAEAAGNSLNYYFTGKELDMTGMYYFGARYYDPKTSVWQSPDPILGKYLNDSKNQNSGKNGSGDAGGKGVFNIMNLALYSYAQQNPLILIDPDGKATVYVQKTGNYYYRDPSNGYTEYIGHGFAGRNDYKNKPDMQGKEKGNNYGPLPTGTYQIGGMQYDRVTDEGSKLPWSMELDQKGNYSSYLIHPDRKLDPGNGSKGCPIADKELGKVIDSDPDRTLIVVSNEDDVSNMAAPVVPYGESRDAQKNAADAIGQGEQHSEQQKKQ